MRQAKAKKRKAPRAIASRSSSRAKLRRWAAQAKLLSLEPRDKSTNPQLASVCLIASNWMP